MSSEPLKQAISCLKGVGPKLEEKLNTLGIHTLQDLLFHLPLRYEDRTRITAIGALRPGVFALIQGQIMIANVVYGRRRSLVAKIQDGTGTISIRLFHFNKTQQQNFKTTHYIQCYGDIRAGASGLEMYHPEYKISATSIAEPDQQAMTAVYPTIKHLQQKTWRSLIAQSIRYIKQSPPYDYIKPYINSQYTLNQALAYIHQPPASANVLTLTEGRHPLQQQLVKEELAAQYIGHKLARRDLKSQKGITLRLDSQAKQRFLKQLPFKLTKAQQHVSTQIEHDISLGEPMLRLVQGDVGSGKTLVAALAALQSIANGYQTAIMAPTEILAEQHFHNFTQWFEPLNIKVGLLVGSIKGKKRLAVTTALANGDIQLIIGTHALFQADIQFYRLALVIIDEQHRFGVHQRLELKQKGEITPHQLVMTATPIPRTLTMTQFAELDCSIIDELPPGRKPITTTLLEASQRDRLIERVRLACQQGQQAYWVCTLIEESETLQAQAAEDTAEYLQTHLAPLNVALIHGRMKPKEKAEVMQTFKTGGSDLLVATTVIEVGVDVPNANLMIIENPERLGLAQLHQLRGRVGRGQTASFCVLLYQKPLSKNGKKRLQAMRDTHDGFIIAEEDLAIRGPGEILGTKQTGELSFKIADLTRDADLIEESQHIGDKLLQSLNTVELNALVKRWLSGKTQYADV